MRTFSLVVLLCLSACPGATFAALPLGTPLEPDAFPRHTRPDAPVQVLVRLRGEPGWVAYARAGGPAHRSQALAKADERARAVAAEQAQFKRALQPLGARVLRELQVIDNVVAVEVPASQLKALGALPGVVGLGPNRRYERTGTTSMPLLRSPELWAANWPGMTSLTGRGVTIGIIDDGIDYTHRHFGGNGAYAGNDRTVAGDAAWPPAAPPAFPGDQLVIGGHDLVGDDYDFDQPRQPDPDPAGCDFSHGTHVAGTAAGHGVTAAGSTFTGNLMLGNLLFPDFPLPSLSAFRVGPGAAPGANLVALRVFGCSGSTGTDVLLDAMELALTGTWLGHDIDVVNMSLGSAFGGSGSDDFLMAAQAALTASGIVVVTSAGNSGNIQLITGAPGTARGTISVAGTTDSGQVAPDSFIYTHPVDANEVRVGAQRGSMYLDTFPDTLSAELALAVPANACTALAEPAPTAWDGKWLVIDRGSCDFVVKTAAAKAAGAAGAIILNHLDDTLVNMSWDGLDASALPAIFLRKTDGDALRTLVAGNVFAGNFDGSGLSPIGTATSPQLVYTSTSRGGVVRGNGDLILKPNIAAPGVSITSAGGGTNDLGYTISGTSMAAPHIAGTVALLIEAHGRPLDADGVALLKQRLMSTATRNVGNTTLAPPFQSPQRVGAGLADAVAAAATTLVAYSADAPDNVSVSFGYPLQRAGLPITLQREVTVRNLGQSQASADISYEAASAWPGATVSVSPASIVVPAGGTATVLVSLEIDATQPNLNVVGDPLFPNAGVNNSFNTFLYEVSGYVRVDPTAGATTPVRVPVYAAPHLVAEIQADPVVVLPTPDGAGASIALSGIGFDLGAGTDDHLSVVSAFELLVADPREEGLAWDVNVDGVIDPEELLTDFASADLRYVGAAAVSIGADQVLSLGLATWGEWTSLRDIDISVDVDLDDDGQIDHRHFITGTSGTASDAFIVAALQGPAFSSGILVDFVNFAAGASLDTMLFRNNVLVMPLYLTGLPGKQYAGGPVQLTIRTFQRDSDFEVLVDSVDATFEPRIIFNGGLTASLYPSLDGASIGFDHAFGSAGGYPSVLTLHHHNLEREARTQVTQLVAPATPFDLLSPANGAAYADGLALPDFTWGAVIDTDAYTISIGSLQFSATAAADGDAISCDATTCTFTHGVLALPPGAFQWNVTALHPAGPLDAANGPFTGQLAGAVPVELFADGFED